MDFIKRKISRFNSTLAHYKVIIQPLQLDLTIDQPGEVWVQFKRGRHIDQTNKYALDAKSGYGR